MLFGEAIGGDGVNGDTAVGYAWAGCGAMWSAYGIGTANWAEYGSFHPQIANFCTADGSVRTISVDVDMTAFRNYSGMADGQYPLP